MHYPPEGSPAADRNKAPIWTILHTQILKLIDQQTDQSLKLLEIASGTGQHIAYFGAQLTQCQLNRWILQPSDIDTQNFSLIQQWTEYEKATNVSPPLVLDAQCDAESWPEGPWHIIYAANMIHISAWESTIGLFRGAAAKLNTQGYLITYGPYRFPNQEFAISNQLFHEQLLARNPNWGIRSINQIDELANINRLQRVATFALPANNHLLCFKKM